MAYIITAILTALICWVFHYIRMMEAIKIIVDATNTIEYLYEKSKTIDEAITLLEKARGNLILRESKRLKAGEITAFIKRVRGDWTYRLSVPRLQLHSVG